MQLAFKIFPDHFQSLSSARPATPGQSSSMPGTVELAPKPQVVFKRTRRRQIEQASDESTSVASAEIAGKVLSKGQNAPQRVHRVSGLAHAATKDPVREEPPPVAIGLRKSKRQLTEPRLTQHHVLIPNRDVASDTEAQATGLPTIVADQSPGPSPQTARLRRALEAKIEDLAASISQWRGAAGRPWRSPGVERQLHDIDEKLRQLRAEVQRPWSTTDTLSPGSSSVLPPRPEQFGSE